MKGSIKTKLDELANKRDGYRCVGCGKDTGIETHHIIEGIEELNNLITLCHSCHKKEHNMSGCFKRGFDPRRDIEAGKKNLEIGHNIKHHPFYGNKYAQIPSSQ